MSLPQPPKHRKYRTVGKHDFKPQTLLAHIAVADDVDAPGVGGQSASDGTGTFGRETHGKEKASLISCGLELSQNDACIDFSRTVDAVDFDVTHGIKADEDALLGVPSRDDRGCCRGVGGVAALHENECVVPSANGHDGRRFFRVFRIDGAEHGTVKTPTVV